MSLQGMIWISSHLDWRKIVKISITKIENIFRSTSICKLNWRLPNVIYCVDPSNDGKNVQYKDAQSDYTYELLTYLTIYMIP